MGIENSNSWIERLSDVQLFSIVDRFLTDGAYARPDLAKELSTKLSLPKVLTRESFYPILRVALKRGMLRMAPKLDAHLQSKIRERFGLDRETVVVVANPDKTPLLVAEKAAERALEILKSLKDKPRPIGIGLGAGGATLDCCRHLSTLLRENEFPRKLALFAISAGCSAEIPEYSPVSFFNLFPQNLIAKRVGLFSEPMVTNAEFEQIKKRPWIAMPFECRHEIDLIITSMGDASDEHDMLLAFLEAAQNRATSLRDAEFVGNVQYRPYSHKGPIMGEPEDFRAVTLFELAELKAFSEKKGKHVLLMARQCTSCGMTKQRALRPLLTNPELRVFTDLVTDNATALELLEER